MPRDAKRLRPGPPESVGPPAADRFPAERSSVLSPSVGDTPTATSELSPTRQPKTLPQDPRVWRGSVVRQISVVSRPQNIGLTDLLNQRPLPRAHPWTPSRPHWTPLCHYNGHVRYNFGGIITRAGPAAAAAPKSDSVESTPDWSGSARAIRGTRWLVARYWMPPASALPAKVLRVQWYGTTTRSIRPLDAFAAVAPPVVPPGGRPAACPSPVRGVPHCRRSAVRCAGDPTRAPPLAPPSFALAAPC